MGRCARRQQQLEVLLRGLAEAGVTRAGRIGDRVDRLAGAIVTRLRHLLLELAPELVHGALVADDHARTPARGDIREPAAVRA